MSRRVLLAEIRCQYFSGLWIPTLDIECTIFEMSSSKGFYMNAYGMDR